MANMEIGKEHAKRALQATDMEEYMRSKGWMNVTFVDSGPSVDCPLVVNDMSPVSWTEKLEAARSARTSDARYPTSSSAREGLDDT